MGAFLGWDSFREPEQPRKERTSWAELFSEFRKEVALSVYPFRPHGGYRFLPVIFSFTRGSITCMAIRRVFIQICSSQEVRRSKRTRPCNFSRTRCVQDTWKRSWKEQTNQLKEGKTMKSTHEHTAPVRFPILQGVLPITAAQIPVISVVCYGNFGVRTGSLLMRSLMKRPAASIIRTLSTLLSIRIDIATARLSVIRIWKQLKSSFLHGQRSVCRQLCCMAKETRFIRPKCPRRRKNSFPRIMSDESFLWPGISFRVKHPEL